MKLISFKYSFEIIFIQIINPSVNNFIFDKIKIFHKSITNSQKFIIKLYLIL